MIRRPPRCTRTDPRFPYTTLFRAAGAVAAMEAQRLNDPLSNKKRAGEAGSSWGCRVGGSLKRSGAAEGREPAGRSPKRGRLREGEIGRAACRERVCHYVYISVVAGSLKKKSPKDKMSLTKY